MCRWHCGSHERKEIIMFTEMMASGAGGGGTNFFEVLDITTPQIVTVNTGLSNITRISLSYIVSNETMGSQYEYQNLNGNTTVWLFYVTTSGGSTNKALTKNTFPVSVGTIQSPNITAISSNGDVTIQTPQAQYWGSGKLTILATNEPLTVA